MVIRAAQTELNEYVPNLLRQPETRSMYERIRAESGEGGQGYQPSDCESAIPDPFDLNSVRREPNCGAAGGVKKVLVDVPVCKPRKHWFVRVHPAEEYRVLTKVIDLKEQDGID